MRIRTLTEQLVIPAHAGGIHVGRMVSRTITFPHRHGFLEFSVVESGCAVQRTAHGLQPLRAGDVVVVRPGQWHGYDQPRDHAVINICIAHSAIHDGLAWLLRDPAFAACCAPDDGPVATATLEDPQAVLEILRPLLTGPGASPVERIARVALALVPLLRALGPKILAGRDQDALTGVDAGVAAALARLNRDPAAAWSLPDIALTMGLSAPQAVRRFRAAVGASPMAWLARRRLELAAQRLIMGDASIQAVASATGWAHPGYFARRFRAAFGCAPAAYRQRYQQHWTVWHDGPPGGRPR